jgi:hypothetical protein
MLPSGSLNTVGPTTSCFRGSITRLACSLSTLSGWVTLLRPRLACGLLAMLWPRGTCTHWVSSSNFKVASRASFPNEPGFPGAISVHRAPHLLCCRALEVQKYVCAPNALHLRHPVQRLQLSGLKRIGDVVTL